MPPVTASRTTVLSRFTANLNLPPGPQEFFAAAAEAVKLEYRGSTHWKRLRCRNVERLTHKPNATIFVLDVGHFVEFDWSWEGAIAFRSSDPTSFKGDIVASDELADPLYDAQPGEWAGEIVEVDETTGRVFVSIGSTDHPPCRGTFFVRPFEFLAFLHSLFCQPESADLKSILPARLNAARGGVHPPVAAGTHSGLPEFGQMWSHSWSVLWGPPGCGKTTNLGRQVAACLGGDERILVVSTTNKATDEAARAIGKAALVASPSSVEQGEILRIGKGAHHGKYEASSLLGMLRGTETELLRQVDSLTRDLERAESPEERAVLRMQIQGLRRSMKDNAFNIFMSPEVKVVVATAFKAVTLLADDELRAIAAAGQAPFTTVIIDEAGLMSRAVVAGLSLLASRRIVVVGDAKQLAPISKMSRVMPTTQATWLASSCLTHLQRVQQVGQGVHLLREQHRMHPEISKVVSHYQYEGSLCDAASVQGRLATLPALLAGQPRAIWYVFDEDGQNLPSIRADRGPDNRSWHRPASKKVLEKLFSDQELRKENGLYITPFRAQAREIASYFAAEKLENWSAGTVHGRQGTEANVVIFDTVNAGSYAWPYDEWKRLVNVGLSRAREFVLVLASRAEMNEPYLRPLLDTLAPRTLKRSGRVLAWEKASVRAVLTTDLQVTADPDCLGSQIERRKALRPVMSSEQQRLCGLTMDGKPRLVRGVAGSGKTLVLAHWLHKTLQNFADKPEARVWAVYANRSLQRLISDTIEEAWKADGGEGRSPLELVQMYHVRNLFQDLFREVGLCMAPNDYDYDSNAARYLQRISFEKVRPRCQAMFIDEAQDMGPSTLKLLSALVEPTNPSDPKSRAINIFYDNAQNIYERPMPTWSEIGLDIRGRRSTVMKESFRSTRPITEYAVNVLYRLQPPTSDPDHRELVKQGLIEQTTRCGKSWRNVRFNQVEGPDPIFKKFSSLSTHFEALSKQVVRWIREEGVKPGDICIIYPNRHSEPHLKEHLTPLLLDIGTSLSFVGEHGWERSEGSVLASTPHSYKGYDSEVIVIATADQFVIEREEKLLANTLYVAMTRARSVLAVYAYAKKNAKFIAQTLVSTLETCLDGLLERPKVEKAISELDDFEDVLVRLGDDKRVWLAELWKSYLIQQEPIIASDGEILAEPLFWFQEDDRVVACFGDEDPGAHTRHKLEDHRINVILPGQNPPEPAPG